MDVEHNRQFWLTCTMASLLSEYHFKVVRRAEVKHQAADAFSLLRSTGEDQTHVDEDLSILAIDVQEDDEQDFHLITVRRNKEILLRATEGQTINTLLKKELVLE